MTTKYEYRYAENGDYWQEFTHGAVWDMDGVAHHVAEEYWDNGDQGDANDFEFIVEVREVDEPSKIEKYRVTADYSVTFYTREITEEAGPSA